MSHRFIDFVWWFSWFSESLDAPCAEFGAPGSRQVAVQKACGFHALKERRNSRRPHKADLRGLFWFFFHFFRSYFHFQLERNERHREKTWNTVRSNLEFQFQIFAYYNRTSWEIKWKSMTISSHIILKYMSTRQNVTGIVQYTTRHMLVSHGRIIGE